LFSPGISSARWYKNVVPPRSGIARGQKIKVEWFFGFKPDY
jgi:hypothetical protein